MSIEIFDYIDSFKDLALNSTESKTNNWNVCININNKIYNLKLSVFLQIYINNYKNIDNLWNLCNINIYDSNNTIYNLEVDLRILKPVFLDFYKNLGLNINSKISMLLNLIP